ncbi:MAG: hypothetical protein E6R00_07020 [Gammaproteobacteria bacterium]|nr:MAG: hypothetical protein E6R00_07020 [Gammaproteobacteria bacterium]
MFHTTGLRVPVSSETISGPAACAVKAVASAQANAARRRIRRLIGSPPARSSVPSRCGRSARAGRRFRSGRATGAAPARPR